MNSYPVCDAASYTITSLGVGLGSDSQELSINHSGQIVGTTFVSGNGDMGYMYDGAIHFLGTLGGATSDATDINASGQIVGYSRRSDNLNYAFLYDHGTMTDLGALLGDGQSYAYGINDSGQVVGYYQVDGGTHAFPYDGAVHDLGTLGGAVTIAYAINSAGQIVGKSQTANGNVHAFSYDGVMHDLGTTIGYAYDINDAGQIVGRSPNSATPAAYLYDDGIATRIPNSGIPSIAYGIDSAGQIVGTGTDFMPKQIGFLYDPESVFHDINNLIFPNLAWRVLEGRDINDAGQIVGVARMNNANYAVLLAPVPEPTTLMLSCAALLGLALVANRRARRCS